MYRAYKYRIYPTKDQEIMFAKTFGCVRFIYNRMLADKIGYYQQTKKMLQTTPAQYKNQFEWLKEVDSLALSNAQLNLQSAYKNFFNKKHSGFPKFKSKKKSRMKYTTNNQNGSIRIENRKLKLPKVGYVKIILHRPMEGKIKSVTIEKTPTGKYYASILTENENQVPEVELVKFIGLDFSMRDLFVTSEGERANYPRYFRKNEKKLIRACRELSKKKLGSKNREKARLKVCRIYEKITFQREDFLHKKSYRLTQNYDAVCIETLNMKAMSRQLKFGKSVMDNSFGKFTNMLDYKLYFQGKKLIKISKWYPSSQLCSICGYKNPAVKDLSLREWKCPQCGTYHDRDVNAAKNIMDEGKREYQTTVGHTGSNACGEGVRHYDSLRTLAQSSLKQEAPAS